MRARSTFLHPRRASRLIAELEQARAELEASVATLSQRLERAEAEAARAHEALNAAEAEQARLRTQLKAAEQDNAANRHLYDTQQAQIDKLAEQFGQVEQMVERYESRINSLKSKLTDARAALNRSLRDYDEELSPVAPLRPAPPPPVDKPRKPAPPAEDADWYTPPPEL